jgi:hypothetical protein
MPVHRSQTIATGKDARVELKFDDGTVLTIGANATLTA